MGDVVDDPRDHAAQIIDLRTEAPRGTPPVAGAQWDERRGRWLVWHDEAQVWMVVDDRTGEMLAPVDDAGLPPTLLRELYHADEIDPPDSQVIDVDRLARPPQPVPGAQWNEVTGRWERWDDQAGAWVEALAEDSSGLAP